MPKPNPGRTIGAKQNLAARIRLLRQERGWTRAQLAEYCAAAGCPIQRTAINAIESDGRGIDVDELVAFTRVFDLRADDLLRPIDEVLDEKVRGLADAIASRMRELHNVGGQLVEDLERLAATKADDWDFYQRVLDRLALESGPAIRPGDSIAAVVDAAIKRLVDLAWRARRADEEMVFFDEDGKPAGALLVFGSDVVPRPGKRLGKSAPGYFATAEDEEGGDDDGKH